MLKVWNFIKQFPNYIPFSPGCNSCCEFGWTWIYISDPTQMWWHWCCSFLYPFPKDTDISVAVGFLTFIGPCIVIYFYSKTKEMHQFLTFILFCSSTLHVSEGFSVHHQESKTIRTASCVRQTDSADCLLAGTRWNWFQFHIVPTSKQSAKSVWRTHDAVRIVLDSWWWTERPSETCRVLLRNKINLRNWCISLVLL